MPVVVLGKSSDVMVVPLSVSVPSDGRLDTIYVMVSPSASVPAKVIVLAVCSVAVTV